MKPEIKYSRSHKVYIQGKAPSRDPRGHAPRRAGAERARRRKGRETLHVQSRRLPLRHERGFQRSRHRGRSPQGPAASARGVDRRARRRGATARDQFRIRPHAARRPLARRAAVRAHSLALPRQARRGHNADGVCQTRHRDARDGVRGHTREHELRAGGHRDLHNARVRASRDRRRARRAACQHQPPRGRTDDYRPQLSREDKHQHRQLGHHVEHRRGGGEGVVEPANGAATRSWTSRRAPTYTRPASGSSATAPCPWAPFPSIRRWRRSTDAWRI